MKKMRQKHCLTWKIFTFFTFLSDSHHISCPTVCVFFIFKIFQFFCHIQMKDTHCRTWNMARNIQKLGKWVMHTILPGIWWEYWKSFSPYTRSYSVHFSFFKIFSVFRHNPVWNTEKLEKWGKHIIGPRYWRENWKTWKMRHKHCLTWNMHIFMCFSIYSRS